MTKKLWPLGALAMIALTCAGCASGSADTGSKNATKHEKGVTFAQCMRDNGVSDFPDPDASGELTIDEIANHSSVDTSAAPFQQALSACKDLEPSGFTGHKRSGQQQKNALAFAQCIRENGVSDFPDPGPDDPMVDTRRIPSTERPGGMSILNAAMQTCRGHATKAGVTGNR